MVVTYKEAQEKLFRFIRAECERRHFEYRNLMPVTGSDKKKRASKILDLKLELAECGADPVRFLEMFGWAPDPKGRFGGRGFLPPWLAPPGMVPLILYPAQKALVEDLWTVILSTKILDLNLLKPRQVAATTIVLGVFLCAWLFLPGVTFLVSTYDPDKIDGGGSGHRMGDALFPRLRMMLDAFMWAFTVDAPETGKRSASLIRFNQHVSKYQTQKFLQDADNPGWLSQSEDKKSKLTRPRWTLFGQEMFQGARGNVILGELPSDQMGKSLIFTAALLDELGEYEAAIKANADRDARNALRPCCDHIVTQGTLPKSGGATSQFKALCDEGDTNSTLVNVELSWTDIAPYMTGGWWTCLSCSSMNPWKGAVGPGSGRGKELSCSKCETVQRVRERACSSPWFEDIKASVQNDKVTLARYYWKDWGEAIGDRAWYTFDEQRAVVPRPDTAGWETIQGFDPGYSSENPAAWMLCRLNRSQAILRIEAIHQAPDWPAQKWIPFFKMWGAQMTRRQTVIYGGEAGRPWYPYTPEEEEILNRISAFAYSPSRIRGDKYGSHKDAGMESAYELYARYGVYVLHKYSTNKGDMVEFARDQWLPRIEIAPDCAYYKPRVSGGSYPSIVEVFQGAKMIPTTGHGEAKVEISGKVPRHVKHLSDCFVYICDEIGAMPHATAGLDGTFSAGIAEGGRCVEVGDGFVG